MFWKLPVSSRAGPTYRPQTALLVKTPAKDLSTNDSPRPQRQPRCQEQVGKTDSHRQLKLALE